MRRREFIGLVGGGVLAWPLVARGQTGSGGQNIRFVIGFSAGGATDIAARVLAASMTQILGQQIFVENRTGAGGTLATQEVAGAAPDGTTILVTPSANAANETLFKDFRYKYDDSFTAVAPVAQINNVLVVHPSLPVHSVGDLIALAKARPPGEILAASSGVGTANHLANELFNMMAGVKLTSVQYRGGGEVVKDLVSGQLKVMFAPIPTVLPFVQSGQLRAVATTGLKRDKLMPELPTVAESGVPGFEVSLWVGLLAPKATPRPVVERLSAATAQALATDEVKAAFAKQGVDAFIGSPDEFAAFYRAEVEKWRKVIVATGMSL